MYFRTTLCLALLATATTAAAQNLTADKPEAIAAFMRQIGYRAELDVDGDGDPRINSSAGGANFSVYFYGCTDHKDCDSVQFSAGFDLDQGATLGTVNDWNSKKRFGRAYLDNEDDPYLEMDLNLAEGGISEANFKDSISLWDKLVSDFRSQIDF